MTPLVGAHARFVYDYTPPSNPTGIIFTGSVLVPPPLQLSLIPYCGGADCFDGLLVQSFRLSDSVCERLLV